MASEPASSDTSQPLEREIRARLQPLPAHTRRRSAGPRIGSVIRRVEGFTQMIGASLTSRWAVQGQAFGPDEWTVRPPRELWAWPDDETAPVEADPGRAARPAKPVARRTGDRKLDRLIAMMTEGAPATEPDPVVAASPGRSARPVRSRPLRGLPSTVNRRGVTRAGRDTAPSSMARRLAPSLAEPPDTDATRHMADPMADSVPPRAEPHVPPVDRLEAARALAMGETTRPAPPSAPSAATAGPRSPERPARAASHTGSAQAATPAPPDATSSPAATSPPTGDVDAAPPAGHDLSAVGVLPTAVGRAPRPQPRQQHHRPGQLGASLHRIQRSALTGQFLGSPASSIAAGVLGASPGQAAPVALPLGEVVRSGAGSHISWSVAASGHVGVPVAPGPSGSAPTVATARAVAAARSPAAPVSPAPAAASDGPVSSRAPADTHPAAPDIVMVARGSSAGDGPAVVATRPVYSARPGRLFAPPLVAAAPIDHVAALSTGSVRPAVGSAAAPGSASPAAVSSAPSASPLTVRRADRPSPSPAPASVPAPAPTSGRLTESQQPAVPPSVPVVDAQRVIEPRPVVVVPEPPRPGQMFAAAAPGRSDVAPLPAPFAPTVATGAARTSALPVASDGEGTAHTAAQIRRSARSASVVPGSGALASALRPPGPQPTTLPRTSLGPTAAQPPVDGLAAVDIAVPGAGGSGRRAPGNGAAGNGAAGNGVRSAKGTASPAEAAPPRAPTPEAARPKTLPERFMAELARQRRERPRPLPMQFRPIARQIVGDRPVHVSTGEASRRALQSVGKVAATTGSVVHLAREPDSSLASHEVMAHELTHVAHASPAPRFFDDDHSDEEEVAARVGQVMARPSADPAEQASKIGALMNRSAPLPRSETVTSRSPVSRQRVTTPVGGTAGLPVAGPLRVSSDPSSAPSTPAAASSATIRRSTDASSSSAAPPADIQRSTSVQDRVAEWESAAAGGAAPTPIPATQTSEAGGGAASTGDGKLKHKDLIKDPSELDALIEAIEERILAEIERRGGRYRGGF